jgi:hypothetical protein
LSWTFTSQDSKPKIRKKASITYIQSWTLGFFHEIVEIIKRKQVTYLAKPAGDSESGVLHSRLQGFKGTGSRDIIQIFKEKWTVFSE